MLDMRVFAHRNFSLSAGIFLAMVMTSFGLNVVFPLVLQNVLGLGALETGLLLIPGGAAIAITAALVGRVYERVGPRLLVLTGAAIAAAGWALLCTVTRDAPIGLILGLHLLISIGLAFMWTPLFTLAMGSLPPALRPRAHSSARDPNARVCRRRPTRLLRQPAPSPDHMTRRRKRGGPRSERQRATAPR